MRRSPFAQSLTRNGRVKMVRPPLRVRTHSARLWTHSPLPRRSRYRTQALPKALPPSDLTHLPLPVVQRGQLRDCVSRSGNLGAVQGNRSGEKGMCPGVARGVHFSDCPGAPRWAPLRDFWDWAPERRDGHLSDCPGAPRWAPLRDFGTEPRSARDGHFSERPGAHAMGTSPGF